MELEKNAPVKYESSIEIDAPIEKVWDVMTNVTLWPNWNNDIKHAELIGGLKEGSIIKWQSGPGQITSKLLKVRTNTEIVWQGRMMGIYAIHMWKLEKIGNQTKVTTSESWSGFLPTLLKAMSRNMLQKAINSGLYQLKTECEKN
mgnify:CR=1 FL=1